MPNILHDIKEKLSTSKSTPDHKAGDSAPHGGEEQTFRILPHPAKSNDPADLQKPSEETGGLRSGQDSLGAFTNNPGPVIPDQNMLKNMPPPKSREELRAEQAALDRQD